MRDLESLIIRINFISRSAISGAKKKLYKIERFVKGEENAKDPWIRSVRSCGSGGPERFGNGSEHLQIDLRRG
jgi:hypothetical protein